MQYLHFFAYSLIIFLEFKKNNNKVRTLPHWPREKSFPTFGFEYPHSCYGFVIQSTKNSSKTELIFDSSSKSLLLALLYFQIKEKKLKKEQPEKCLLVGNSLHKMPKNLRNLNSHINQTYFL
ncbi:unnamed protein product [Paramecium octaurelia]|uniref:Uncharacterized protein n=1 Tax=Paramecium octaurelia TaxID=43137 RepID=A0A8S1TS58_PAROT|nr:unnamed protein product [Paramecium octaurelia]